MDIKKIMACVNEIKTFPVDIEGQEDDDGQEYEMDESQGTQTNITNRKDTFNLKSDSTYTKHQNYSQLSSKTQKPDAKMSEQLIMLNCHLKRKANEKDEEFIDRITHIFIKTRGVSEMVILFVKIKKGLYGKI